MQGEDWVLRQQQLLQVKIKKEFLRSKTPA